MVMRSTFHEAVEASFAAKAVKAEHDDEWVILNLGVEGVRSFLEGCLAEAQDCGASDDVLAMESLKQVFEKQGWTQDMSLKRKDLTTLIDSLGVSGANEQDSSDGISASTKFSR